MKSLTCILLTITLCAQAQVDSLQHRLNKFYDANLPLKIHVQTNQERYAAGDTIFYSVYFLSARGHAPINNRSVLRTELTTHTGQLIASQQISVRNGIDYNQMVVPRETPGGSYALRFYNHWMLGADTSLIFSKPLLLGNTKSSPTPETLRAYPEGGRLVEGLNTKIVVRGKPNALISLSNRSGVLQTTKSNLSGYGIFWLKPERGVQYFVASEGSTTTLPSAQSDGAAITVTTARDAIRSAIQLSDNSKFRDRRLTLILMNQGEIIQAANVVFKKNQPLMVVNFPLNGIPPGIATIALVDDQQRTVLERLVYVRQKPIDATLQVQQDNFNTRAKVAMRLSVKDENGKPLAARLNARALHIDMTFDSLTAVDLETNLHIQSDLGYAEPLPSTDVASIDDVLVTSSWKRFSWDQLDHEPHGFIFEQNLHFRGRAIFSDTGLPVPDSTHISFFLQKTVVAYQDHTGPNGQLDFPMAFDFFDSDEMFFRAEHNGVTLKNVKIITDQSKPSVVDGAKGGNAYDIFARDRARLMATYSFFGNALQSGTRFTRARTTFEEAYVKPDVTVRLADYLIFPTMSETLREIIPLVRHRVTRDGDVVRMYNDETDITARYDPVFIIDGVMTDNVGYFLSLKPADVATMKLIYSSAKMVSFGPLGRGGIIIVETKIPGNSLKVPRSSNSLMIPGLSQRVAFKNVTHSPIVAKRTPDLRTSLMWIQDMRTNPAGETDLEFFTSDVPGRYLVEVQGITDAGALFTARKIIEVKFAAAGN